MNVKKWVVSLGILYIGLSAHAQNVIEKLPQAVGTALNRQAAAQVLSTKLSSIYHPVFGYISRGEASCPTQVACALGGNLVTQSDDFIQVAPILDPTKNTWYTSSAFDEAIYVCHEHNKLTEAVYLWRLAHPHRALRENPFLFELSKKVLEWWSYTEIDASMDIEWEIPNYLFLNRMVNHHTPTSYAQLYELTPFYPKHVTLNDYGFPIKTANDELFSTVDGNYARILDNYLMLSNPEEMGVFNTAGKNKYTPFILTKEEHAAANKLLALRLQSEKLPENPTPRDLLELAYNRLETHSIPYTQIDEVSRLYQAYPDYRNTQLYRLIKEQINGQYPIESRHNGFHILENPDITHLIVLDAVMGGVDLDNLADARRALDAFDKLCAEISPRDEEAITHVTILQKNLRLVFDPLINIHPNINPKSTADWSEEKIRLANLAWSLLEASSVRGLVGRNWEQR